MSFLLCANFFSLLLRVIKTDTVHITYFITVEEAYGSSFSLWLELSRFAQTRYLNRRIFFWMSTLSYSILYLCIYKLHGCSQGILKGEVSLYHWPPVWLVWISCFANKNKKCRLSYSWFQTSQTGGQWYSDTSPFIIPWCSHRQLMELNYVCCFCCLDNFLK